MPGIRLGSRSGSRLARSVAGGGGGAAAPAAGGACAELGATDTAGEPGPDTTPAPDPAATGGDELGEGGETTGTDDDEVEDTDTPGLCGADVPC